MADKIVLKEPGEIRTETVGFDDEMETYEDVDSVDVSPYKLTGSNPRSYEIPVEDTHELVIEKLLGGEPAEVKSLDVYDDFKGVLQIFESEEPVDAPEVLPDGAVDPQQKEVDITLASGRDQIDYLLQVDVTTTTDNEISKELLMRVRSE